MWTNRPKTPRRARQNVGSIEQNHNNNNSSSQKNNNHNNKQWAIDSNAHKQPKNAKKSPAKPTAAYTDNKDAQELAEQLVQAQHEIKNLKEANTQV